MKTFKLILCGILLNTITLFSQNFMAPELIFSNFGTNQSWSEIKHERIFSDITGDGKTEIVGFGDNKILVSQKKYGTKATYTTPTGTGSDFLHAGGWTSKKHIRLLADVNGDSRKDIIAFGDSKTFVALLSTGGMFGETKAVIDNLTAAQGWDVNKHPRTTGDVNGDGKIDIIGFGGSKVFAALGNGDGTFQQLKTITTEFCAAKGWDGNQPRAVADLNGDGKVDLIGFGKDGVYVSMAQANGTYAPKKKAINNFSISQGWNSTVHERVVADLNNDGKLDVVGFGGAAIYCSYGIGNGTFGEPKEILKNSFTTAKGWTKAKHVRTVADIDEDGKNDIVGIGAAGVYVAYSGQNKIASVPKSPTGSSTGAIPNTPTGGGTSAAPKTDTTPKGNPTASPVSNKDFTPKNTYTLNQVIGRNADPRILNGLIKKDQKSLFNTISTDPNMITLLNSASSPLQVESMDFLRWWYQPNQNSGGEVICANYIDAQIPKDKKAYWQNGGRTQLVKAIDDRNTSKIVLYGIDAVVKDYHNVVNKEIELMRNTILFDRIQTNTQPFPHSSSSDMIIDNALNFMSGVTGDFGSLFDLAAFVKAAVDQGNEARGQTVTLSGDLSNNGIRNLINKFEEVYDEYQTIENNALKDLRSGILKDATLCRQMADLYRKSSYSSNQNYAAIFNTELNNKKVNLKIRKQMLDVILPEYGSFYGLPRYSNEESLSYSNHRLSPGKKYNIHKNATRPSGMEDAIGYSLSRAYARSPKKKTYVHDWYLAIGGKNRFGKNDVVPTILNRDNNSNAWSKIIEAYNGNSSELFNLILSKAGTDKIDNDKFYYHSFTSQVNTRGGFASGFDTDKADNIYKGFLTTNGENGVLPQSIRDDYETKLWDPIHWFIYGSRTGSKIKPITRIDFNFKVTDGTDSKIGVKVKYYDGRVDKVSDIDALYTDFIIDKEESVHITINGFVKDIKEIRLYSDGSGTANDLGLTAISANVNAHLLKPKNYTFKSFKDKELENSGQMIVLTKNTMERKDSDLSDEEEDTFDDMSNGGY